LVISRVQNWSWKDKNRLRQFDRSIICTVNNSINRLSVEPTSISWDAIDRFSKHHEFNRSTFDRSTSRLPEGPDIFKSLCYPNQKLTSMDRNGHWPPLFVRLELILDEFLCKSISMYMRLVLRFNYALLGVSDFPRESLVNFTVL